eukprot:scaffold7496_cov84-Skeletonema_dohrnii-CCMP3373.AAC.2
MTSQPWRRIGCPLHRNVGIYPNNIASSNAIGSYGHGLCGGSGRIDQIAPFFMLLVGSPSDRRG